MCGFTGFWAHGGWPADPEGVLRRMTATLAHRGPDDEGRVVVEEAGLALGFRRLAIIDVSAEGHQPMRSASGRYLVVFNGEIYNFGEIRDELTRQGARFRGHSDTEVMLAAFERWGLSGAIARFVGMFAFALWDARERALHLVRDRLGEKPLYYARVGRSLVFGSELKSLRQYPGWPRDVDRGVLALFLRLGYVPAPHAIEVGARKVVPGTIVTFRGEGDGEATEYWSARAVVERGLREPITGSPEEIADECDALVRRAVRREMVADVPLGAFLSGGIDSSLIVAMMQAQSDRPVRTFTIGFHEREYNEAAHAEAVARHLGTDHTELYVSPAEAMAVIPRLPVLYDEPFADASQIPTFLVSELARRHVTVSLSGDGGDELFGGYNRYFWGRRLGTWTRRVPRTVRALSARALTTLRADQWDALAARARRLTPAALRVSAPGDRVHKLAGILAADGSDRMYRALVSQWSDGPPMARAAVEPATRFTQAGPGSTGRDIVHRMMYLDLVTYLPDDILVKVDRASMGVGLESRAPFLDHTVVEFAWRVPLALKVRDGRGKILLRTLLDRYVPRSLVDRPKTGFGVPLDRWLRGPLADWAADLLDPPRLRREGYLDAEAVSRKWQEHLGGRRNWQYALWTVLAFQAWLADGR